MLIRAKILLCEDHGHPFHETDKEWTSVGLVVGENFKEATQYQNREQILNSR
jgi:hypothetical protein